LPKKLRMSMAAVSVICRAERVGGSI
jgi:hypothetical protein